MDNIVYGGKPFYGYDIGILMLDTHFPRIPGDVGNALTWNFPVLYKVVKGSMPKKVVLELTDNDIMPFVEAALELQDMGVRAITTSCGFLSMFQENLAKVLNIPIFTSALMQLPILSVMNVNKKILVLTANSSTLTKRHLDPVCGSVNPRNYTIVGMEHEPNFTWFTVHNWEKVDTKLCEIEILHVIDTAIQKDTYAAILLECTNMPPYRDSILKAFNLPVYDFVTLTNFIYSSYCRGNYEAANSKRAVL